MSTGQARSHTRCESPGGAEEFWPFEPTFENKRILRKLGSINVVTVEFVIISYVRRVILFVQIRVYRYVLNAIAC